MHGTHTHTHTHTHKHCSDCILKTTVSQKTHASDTSTPGPENLFHMIVGVKKFAGELFLDILTASELDWE